MYSACALRGDCMYPPETNMRPLLSAWACNACSEGPLQGPAPEQWSPRLLTASPPARQALQSHGRPQCQGSCPLLPPRQGCLCRRLAAWVPDGAATSHLASDSHEQRNLQDPCPASCEVGPVPACLRGLCALCKGVKPHQRRAGLASLDIRKRVMVYTGPLSSSSKYPYFWSDAKY